MEQKERKRPPRIVVAFAVLAVTAVLAAVAYVFDPPHPTDGHETAVTQVPQTDAKKDATQSQQQVDGPKQDQNKEQTQEPKQSQEQRSTHKEVVKKPEATIEPRAVKHALEGDSATTILSSTAYGKLTQAIGALEDKGYTVAFVVHDIATGHEIAYNCDEELYPASSIKGPFTTCVYQMLVETGKARLKDVEPVARITILESSDEGYRTLHKMFGEEAFVQWLKDAGVEPGSYGSYASMVSWNYPHIGARKLELMWMHIYDYLTTSKSKAAKQLAELFDNREVSSMRKAIGDKVRTWSKMGWFDSFSNYRSEPATVEAGVVFAKSGDYVFSVMTTAPAELDAIIPLEKALNMAHVAM